MNRTKAPLTILAILALALAVAVAVGFTTGDSTNRTAKKTAASSTSSAKSTQKAASASTAAALQSAFIGVYKKVSPSVVQIRTPEGLGSGIVFDKKGDIVTNNHVVGTYTTFTVTTSTGKQYNNAKLVGAFPADDLAVIKVPAGNLPPASFADSKKLQIGDIAMAIGNPLGFASSFTQGLVSAIDRDVPEGNGVVLANAIQTSAPINPGNSGGALVDIQGRVIGIPTLGAEDPQMGGAAVGIGFAIPSDTVTSIASQLIQHGHVVNSNKPYVGVQVGDTGNGVYVGVVEAKSPAAKAGLQVGDVIVALDRTPTPTTDALGTALAKYKPGQAVTLTVMTQSGQKKQVKVTLGQYPGTAQNG